MPRRLSRAALLAPALTAALALLTAPGGPAGTSPLAELVAGERAAGPAPAGATDTEAVSPRLAARSLGVLASIANADAVAKRDAIAREGGPGTGGTWHAYGVAPVLNNTTYYTPVDSIPTFTGRITDFASDPATGRVWAGVGLSGVYETRDMGAHWRAITDSLPNTTTGAVGFSPSHGGTLFDATGDFDGGYLGLGVWRSLDGGAHWLRSQGIPDGLMSTRVAVDPTNPDVVYVATHRGLFRSTDDGAQFVNVALPVGATQTGGPNCAGDMTHPQCALASVVTDVVVRPPDAHDKGGEVLAAVGWERGWHPTSQGWNNAVGNGLYASPSGMPHSFTNTDASANGFTSQTHIGRVSLSEADGPMQNHDVLWAMVEDAQTENGQYPVIDPVNVSAPGVGAVPPLCAVAPCYQTALDNVYESTDFGKTWHAKLPPPQTLGVSCPVTSTDLCLLVAAPVVSGYAPGIQARYNNYLRIDPTSTAADGTPTRIIMGLEEVWEINLNDSLNQNPTGLVVPRTVGRYFGNGFCPETQLVGPVSAPNPPVCPGQNDAPTTTHPDQHAGIWIPDGKGGATYFAGNDGGVFSQHVEPGQDLVNSGWGVGDNRDMNTTLNYDMAVSGDGVVYTGLQDNGEVRIDPATGQQVEVFGGDAFYSATDPANSKVVYEEYTLGNMNVSTDGGHTWRNINPSLTSPQFSTPFTMDATDPNHLVTGGEDVEETISGPNTTVHPVAQVDTGLDADGIPSPTDSTDWHVVFDLGTDATSGTAHALSAVDTRGDSTYVGWCGPCYVFSTVSDFSGGIATNVGGSAKPQKETKNGWHIAKAVGLPNRYVTAVRVDPHDSRTVYVTLADYDPTVEYRAPGVLGDHAKNLGHGHVYKSTDAGEHFTDISANLPDAPASDVIVRGSQLIAATNVGVFISRDLNGGHWYLLGGTQLPVLHTTTIRLQPGNADRLFAATYGKGVWVYDFPGSAHITAAPVPVSANDGRSSGIALPNTAAVSVRTGGEALGALLLGGAVALRSRRRRRRGRSTL